MGNLFWALLRYSSINLEPIDLKFCIRLDTIPIGILSDPEGAAREINNEKITGEIFDVKHEGVSKISWEFISEIILLIRFLGNSSMIFPQGFLREFHREFHQSFYA